jgi:dephospho-CoA kinase
VTVRIGLTGPIGCGKSTIAGWLGELGAVVVDADLIAREVVEPGEPAFEAVVRRFGESVVRPDGSLDRAGLGRVVFADPAALADLERIVHPAVRPRIADAVGAAERAAAPAVVIEAIKLVEAGYAAECDEVWLVVCAADVQRVRLHERGASPSDAEQRIAAQGADLAARLDAVATRVIDSSGPREEVRRAIGSAFRDAVGASASQSTRPVSGSRDRP